MMSVKVHFRTFLIVCVASVACFGEVVAQPAAETFKVEVQQAGTLIPVGAVVVPATEVTLAAQAPGRVESISGAEGNTFRAGVSLLKLDSEELRAQRQQIAAEIARAEAAVRNSQVQYQRELQDPQRRGGMGMPMFDQMFGGQKQSGVERGASLYGYGTQVEQARAALYQAQSRLKEVDARLRDTETKAPFDGVITKKFVDIGQTVQPGQPLFTYADLGGLRVQADVPTRLALGLRTGDKLSARLDDPNKTAVSVIIAQVFPMADPTRHTVRIKCDLPADAPAAAGMYAQVLIHDPAAATGRFPVIPTSAVVYRGGLPMAYVVRADGTRELRLLRLGEAVGSDRVAVLTGLEAGEDVLMNP